MTPLALLADIGGTNTRVALSENGHLVTGSSRRYRNTDFDTIETVLLRYLAETETPTPSAACLAMAGPVREGEGRLTNLNWTISTARVAKATGMEKVCILNDLQAQGHALGHLPDTALLPVLPGAPERPSTAPELVIGVGTGFNAAPVFPAGGGRVVPPSEAGHVSLPVLDAADVRLAQYVARRHGFADIEEVLSGRGLENVYAWHARDARSDKTSTSAEIMAALEAGDPLAEAAAATFVKFMGRVSGDLALTILPFGGVFLIGGMSRAMMPYFQRFDFGAAFHAKGRFSDYMSQFSVSVIADDDAALIGSAQYLSSLSKKI